MTKGPSAGERPPKASIWCDGLRRPGSKSWKGPPVGTPCGMAADWVSPQGRCGIEEARGLLRQSIGLAARHDERLKATQWHAQSCACGHRSAAQRTAVVVAQHGQIQPGEDLQRKQVPARLQAYVATQVAPPLARGASVPGGLAEGCPPG